MRILKTILTRLGLSAPPFVDPVNLLVVVSQEEDTTWITRWLAQRWARVEMVHSRSEAYLAAARTKFDAAIIDLGCGDVWGVVSDLRPGMPVLGIVRHESTGIKALMRGIDGVLNRLTLREPELVGTLQRVIGSRRASGGCPPCEAAEEALVTASRTLDRVGEVTSRYAH